MFATKRKKYFSKKFILDQFTTSYKTIPLSLASTVIIAIKSLSNRESNQKIILDLFLHW